MKLHYREIKKCGLFNYRIELGRSMDLEFSCIERLISHSPASGASNVSEPWAEAPSLESARSRVLVYICNRRSRDAIFRLLHSTCNHVTEAGGL